MHCDNPKTFTCALILLLLILTLPSKSFGEATQFAQSAGFDRDQARARSVKILLQSRRDNGVLRRADIGSGFLISADGLFVTAYHVMKYCLEASRSDAGFSVAIDCSREHPKVQYIAQNNGREFEIEVVSHLRREESTLSGLQSPDDAIKLRDFVVGRLKIPPGARVPYWPLRDFKNGTIDLTRPHADFELKPLVPPRRVFVAGYAEDRDFAIAEGFLNVTEDFQRGYFAANIPLYPREHLEAWGIPADTEWGIAVENHMSGGAVVDFSGSVVGVVIGAMERSAAILSIENLLETFFSRAAAPGTQPAVLLTPTKAPLYLRTSAERASP